ncbi:MAG TPA: metallophosphoesterase [Candidatus Dormibacteraeota bacterium]
MNERPVLVVGDVQGDVERLQEALQPYPEDEVDTVFLGDFFQGGQPGAGGGAAAARVARARHNSISVLGNHDLFLLVVLERARGVSAAVEWQTRSGVSVEELWLNRRGDWADLRAVADDPGLEAWLRSLPLMLLLDDGTLAQHTDDDRYAELGASVTEVNGRTRELLDVPGGVMQVLRYTIGRHAFDDAGRLDRYLRRFGARRLVHGHTPHHADRPLASHGGRVLSYDGRFSRFWSRDPDDASGPMGATVALLPPLDV